MKQIFINEVRQFQICFLKTSEQIPSQIGYINRWL